MNQLIKISTLLFLVTSLSACIVKIDAENWDDEHNWKNRQDENSQYINRLDLGVSIADVRSDLGEPDYSDSFQRNGAVFHVLYYRTQHQESDGKTNKDETTPLVFIDKKLVGWGDLAIEKATE